ncbi:VOC family protein [Gammaproteobacteria bacterium]|nr:VOC family protein [Gammaproteobacteria bacterium]
MINRRKFLTGSMTASGAIVLPLGLGAQSDGAAISVEKLNYLEIRVSNPGRTIAFYQDLFGLPVQSRSGDHVFLKIGDNKQFMALRPLQSSETPAIVQLGYSVKGFDVDMQLNALKDNGFREIDPPADSAPGIDNMMSAWVKLRGDTPELYFSDARGVIVQLSDTSWCGGSGPLGNVCGVPESTTTGIFTLEEINHFTCFVNDGAGANLFYQDFFGLEVQSYQGPGSPVTGIGDGKQFVMYAGPFPGGENAPANIHHASFNMSGFNVDDILGKLTDYGLSARGDKEIGPMMHYISLRMPARGGAEGGTPEVYFTDPDGILMQLQDITYCGGGGYLGNQCLL